MFEITLRKGQLTTGHCVVHKGIKLHYCMLYYCFLNWVALAWSAYHLTWFAFVYDLLLNLEKEPTFLTDWHKYSDLLSHEAVWVC